MLNTLAFIALGAVSVIGAWAALRSTKALNTDLAFHRQHLRELEQSSETCRR